MARLLAVSLACIGVLALHADASATDQPISAVKLSLRRSVSGHERLTFVTKDARYLFPQPGGPDDPATGTPGGARLELFASGPTGVAFEMPAGNGAPGWTYRETRLAFTFQFINADAPDAFSDVKKMRIRRTVVRDSPDTKTTVRVVGEGVGLPLPGSQGTVAVRITTGTLRSCTIFGPATIVADVPGKFVARNATGAGISDCSAQALGAAVCGNGVRETDEACDGSDTGACLGACQSNCTCAPACGDDQVNQPSEQCDGTADSLCPGACLPNCLCPTCGDGSVNQASEQCDGGDDSACPDACQPNCLCLGTCGDNLVNQPSEQCDGTGAGGVCGPPPNGFGCRPSGGPEECTCCSVGGFYCETFGCCGAYEVCIAGPNHGGHCCGGFGASCTTTSDCCAPLPCSGGICCGTSGFPCNTTADCCSSLTCSGNFCTP